MMRQPLPRSSVCAKNVGRLIDAPLFLVRQPTFALGIGLLFCAIVVTLPELIPLVKGRDGAVWTPVRSMNYRIGDLYYYAAYVRELLQGSWPILSPTASDQQTFPLIETWRFLPILIASAPGLITSDLRWVILLGYAFSGCLIFGLSWSIVRSFIKGVWTPVAIGLLVLFAMDRIWTPFPTHAQSIGQLPSWVMGLGSLWGMIAANVPEYDYFGNLYRYVNMSFSAPILLLYFLATIKVNNDLKRMWIVVLALLSPAMAFSYPSHALIAYALLIGFSMQSMLRRNWEVAAIFVGVGLATLIFLWAIDYRSYSAAVFTHSELWKNIFAQESFALARGDLNSILAVVFGKYFISGVAMLLITRNDRQLGSIINVIVPIGFALSLLHLFAMPQLWARFLGRGIDVIWFLSLCICISTALLRAVEHQASESWMARMRAYLAQGSMVAIFISAVAVPAKCFAHMGMINGQTEARYISTAYHDFLTWIDRHVTSRPLFASADWEDITLLPIYTNADLVVGHSVIDGRSPLEELTRYVEQWKFFGRSWAELDVLLDRGPSAALRTGLYGARPPFLNEPDFEASQLMLGVLYWPYVGRVKDVLIVGAENKVTPEFRSLVHSLYTAAQPDRFLDRYAVGYIATNAAGADNLAGRGQIVKIFENPSRIVFRVTSALRH